MRDTVVECPGQRDTPPLTLPLILPWGDWLGRGHEKERETAPSSDGDDRQTDNNITRAGNWTLWKRNEKKLEKRTIRDEESGNYFAGVMFG
jgi:hypothetical protein